MQRDHVAHGEQLVERQLAGFSRDSGDLVGRGVDHPRAEGRNAHRHGLADAPEAHDSHGLASEAFAHEVGGRPAAEAALAQLALTLGKAPQEGDGGAHCELRRRFGENVGRVGDRHAAGPRRSEVDVVHANRVVGDDAQAGPRLEQLVVDPIGEESHEANRLGERGKQPRARHLDGHQVERGDALERGVGALGHGSADDDDGQRSGHGSSLLG